MKSSVLKDIHCILEEIFDHKYDGKFEKSIRLLKTHEVVSSLQMLHDLGKVIINDNVSLLLVENKSGATENVKTKPTSEKEPMWEPTNLPKTPKTSHMSKLRGDTPHEDEYTCVKNEEQQEG